MSHIVEIHKYWSWSNFFAFSRKRFRKQSQESVCRLLWAIDKLSFWCFVQLKSGNAMSKVLRSLVKRDLRGNLVGAAHKPNYSELNIPPPKKRKESDILYKTSVWKWHILQVLFSVIKIMDSLQSQQLLVPINILTCVCTLPYWFCW